MIKQATCKIQTAICLEGVTSTGDGAVSFLGLKFSFINYQNIAYEKL